MVLKCYLSRNIHFLSIWNMHICAWGRSYNFVEIVTWKKCTQDQVMLQGGPRWVSVSENGTHCKNPLRGPGIVVFICALQSKVPLSCSSNQHLQIGHPFIVPISTLRGVLQLCDWWELLTNIPPPSIVVVRQTTRIKGTLYLHHPLWWSGKQHKLRGPYTTIIHCGGQTNNPN